MRQETEKAGEGEVTKGKKEGIQALQAQLQWKHWTLQVVLRSKLGLVFPAAREVATHLGYSLISQTPDTTSRAVRASQCSQGYQQQKTRYHRHWQCGMGTPQGNNNHLAGITHSLLFTPPAAAQAQALLSSGTSCHCQLLCTRKFAI